MKDKSKKLTRLVFANANYEKPRVDTFSSKQLAEIIGPAQGYGGAGRGRNHNPRGSEGGTRAYRLFPGLR